jgi:TonB family protein
MSMEANLCRLKRVVTLSLLLLVAGEAAALGSSLYPDLMEFEAAFELHERGELERARNGFRHLAELGDPEARLNLGVMLAKGEGGDADPVEAAAWIRWAADQGSEGAAQVLPIVERSLDDAQRELAAARLAELREAHGPLLRPETSTTSPGSALETRLDCLVARLKKTPPVYPRKALERGQTGFAVVYFLVSPEGNITAPSDIPGARRDDLFGPAARRAVRQWDARACTGDDYYSTKQTITFEFSSDNEPGAYRSMERKRAARQLAKARAGDPGDAYVVGLLAGYFPGLFDLAPGEELELMLAAAVAGIPAARWELAMKTGRRDDRQRWRILAARQGFEPALDSMARWSALPAPERREAMLRASADGYLPAVYMAVRHLAAHPEAAERDGALALRLSSAIPGSEMRADPSLAEMHAMALAENGQFREAVAWQQRAITAARKLDRDLSTASARLAAYEAGEPWRDSRLAMLSEDRP